MSNDGSGARNQEHIWDYFQTEGVESFGDSRPRLRHLAKRLPIGSRVLNIGVGGGIFEEAALSSGLVPSSLDPSEAAIERLRERLQLGDRARVGYIQEIPFEAASFDAVVLSEVVEHLDDETTRAGLSEVRRVLVAGGRLLITVPANEDLGASTVVCPHCGERFHRWGHQRSFDESAIREVVTPWFDVDAVEQRAFIEWPSLNWKGKLEGLARVALARAGVHGSNEVFVVDARRR